MAGREKSKLGARGTAHKGSGLRRKNKGRMVGPDGSPRSSTHGGHTQATVSFTMGDTAVKAEPTKHVQGRFKVPAPTKRKHRGIYRDAEGAELT